MASRLHEKLLRELGAGMITPVRSGSGLVAEMKSVLRSGSPELHVWWLGQSGFLLIAAGRCLLFDPYLSDSLTRKYASTDKPHVRMSHLVVEPGLLDFVDVVTSSHMHTDHMDAETLIPLKAVNPNLELVIPEANRGLVVERLKVPETWPVGLDAGVDVEIKGIRILGVPAAHNELTRDKAGRHVYLGYVVKWGGLSIYHSGDTLHFDGMEAGLKQHRVDLALLPINGNKPERRVAGNLDGQEAARLAKGIGARLVIPCHYDLFEFNTASPELFVRECIGVGQRYEVMRLGGCHVMKSEPAR